MCFLILHLIQVLQDNMPRFATNEQSTKIAGLSTSIANYIALFDGILNSLAGYIEVFSPESGIEIRYITGEGRDDELWRGNLLSASLPPRDKVDVWCLTILGQQGASLGGSEAIGSFDKPFQIGIDYFYDYDFGTDMFNSEDDFNSKIAGFDFILEEIRTCLPNGCEIKDWTCRRAIKRFTNASTHQAKFDLNLIFNGL
jgi:hypothetical protein